MGCGTGEVAIRSAAPRAEFGGLFDRSDLLQVPLESRQETFGFGNDAIRFFCSERRSLKVVILLFANLPGAAINPPVFRFEDARLHKEFVERRLYARVLCTFHVKPE